MLPQPSHRRLALFVSPMARNKIINLLKGGDRRSIGRADSVALMVDESPELFAKLIAGMWDEDPIVRMRSADAAEKVTRQNCELLKPYRKELLSLLAETTEQEVRWHLALIVPRLPLNAEEKERAVFVLKGYLDDRSSIVKTCALQGLANFAEVEPNIRTTVIKILQEARRRGTAAMKARSRRLLRGMEKA